MKKLLGIIGVFAFTSLFVISANAAFAQNARGGDVYRATTITGTNSSINTARMPSMPGGIGGVTGSNLGGNTTTNVTSCTPGATRTCTTTNGQPGTQTCNANGTWGACVASAVTYTIAECMDAILACINDGGLPGGIVDMYDSNLRNSIISGMSLCRTQVDYCVANIGIYNDSSDVWIDFNSRVVQPQYYSFILRKTGLTPHQAENTCLLLDKNVYGKSFAAVSSNGNEVNGEYNNRVGAYNEANKGTIMKSNPQGPDVNNFSYDGGRGHYARWDAITGECLVRVAAYNKDDLITNKWLGIGDDKAAEVWKAAGSSFSCNKELFEFGLMNQTKSVAVIGGVTAVAATGVGLWAGAAKDKKADTDNFCEDKRNLEKLSEQLSGNIASLQILNEYLTGDLTLDNPSKSAACKSKEGENNEKLLTYKPYLSISNGKINKSNCENIMALYDKYLMYQGLIDTGVIKNESVTSTNKSTKVKFSIEISSNDNDENQLVEFINTEYDILVKDNPNATYGEILHELKTSVDKKITQLSLTEESEAVKAFNQAYRSGENSKVKVSSQTETSIGDTYHSISLAWNNTAGVSCTSCEADCVDGATIIRQVRRIGGLLDTLDIAQEKEILSNKAKGALIGAGVGVGSAGLATAITAFVEKNNINCRIGDGLDKIQMGKSGNIDTLKNFYVKWNLTLPDTIAPTPTAPVTDCASWTAACSTLTSIANCSSATVNFRPSGAATPIRVFNGCSIVNGVCVENRPVVISHGLTCN